VRKKRKGREERKLIVLEKMGHARESWTGPHWRDVPHNSKRKKRAGWAKMKNLGQKLKETNLFFFSFSDLGFGTCFELNLKGFKGLQNLRFHRPTPLRLNLVLEIQSDP
jgi:hypothetical protein